MDMFLHVSVATSVIRNRYLHVILVVVLNDKIMRICDFMSAFIHALQCPMI